MGKGKLSMELISNEKSRNVTFNKRKDGLIRKIHEFVTLCDVSGCMIIYGPNQETGFSEPEIWPPNLEEVRCLVGIYKAKNEKSAHKTSGLSDFFHEREQRIKDELHKLRKENLEAKYPTRPEFMKAMPEPQLKEFAEALNRKSDYVRSRIKLLRGKSEGVIDVNVMDQSSFNQESMEMNNDKGSLDDKNMMVLDLMELSTHNSGSQDAQGIDLDLKL